MAKKAPRRLPISKPPARDHAQMQAAFATLLYGHRLTHLTIVEKPRNPDSVEVYEEELDTFDVDLTFDNGLVYRVRSYWLPDARQSWGVNIWQPE